MREPGSEKRTRPKISEAISQVATRWSGSSGAFGLALLVVVAWLVSGPLFGFSDTWQLVINTGTTIITFLMVFLIQRAQNKEALALQLKLNELVASLDCASNRLVDVESLSEADLAVLHEYFHELAGLARAERDIHKSHSVDEARALHEYKQAARERRAR